MAKKLGALTSIILGVAGGAAAAAFLATESGKKVKKQVSDFVKDYQENRDEINADLVNKANDLKDQAVDRFEDVKGQLESGELTIDDLIQSGKEKVQDLTEQLKDKFAEVKTSSEAKTEASEEDKAETIIEVPEEDVVVQDDIEIDL